jgi:TPR repeat protein
LTTPKKKQEAAAMPFRAARVIGMFCVALSLGATPIASATDFDEDLAAAKSGDYATVLQKSRSWAEEDDARAQFNLGVMYANGQGVSQDYAEAVAWYRNAAEQSDASAQFNLGLMYYKGQGAHQNYLKAHMWWNLAASKGHTSAAENRDILAQRMTSQQVDEAQALARNYSSFNPIKYVDQIIELVKKYQLSIGYILQLERDIMLNVEEALKPHQDCIV